MELKEAKGIFFIAVAAASLLVASPALSRIFTSPRAEYFTEFWLLDQNRGTSNYPFNISRAHDYAVLLGIANRLGSLAYYMVEVKFRNWTMPAPDPLGKNPSQTTPLLDIRIFLEDYGNGELSITFSLDYEIDSAEQRASFHNITLNGRVFDLNDQIASWDPIRKDFYANLYFELWIYNSTLDDFEYHNRSVGLRLNMTDL